MIFASNIWVLLSTKYIFIINFETVYGNEYHIILANYSKSSRIIATKWSGSTIVLSDVPRITESFVKHRTFPAPVFGIKTPHVRCMVVLIFFAGCHIPIGSFCNSFRESISISLHSPVSMFQQKWNPPWCKCRCRELIIESFWQFCETVFVTTVAVTNTTATHITSPESGSKKDMWFISLGHLDKNTLYFSNRGCHKMVYLCLPIQRRNHCRTSIFSRQLHKAFGPWCDKRAQRPSNIEQPYNI